MSYIEEGFQGVPPGNPKQQRQWKLLIEGMTQNQRKELLDNVVLQIAGTSVLPTGEEEQLELLLECVKNKALYPVVAGKPAVDDRVPLSEIANEGSITDWLGGSNSKTMEALGNPLDLKPFREVVLKASQSVAMVTSPQLIERRETFGTRIGRSHGSALGFSGRFADQLSIGFGTAFLIRENVLLTTAHSFYLTAEERWMNEEELAQIQYVFDWVNPASSLPAESEMNFLKGSIIPGSLKYGRRKDHVLIQLERAVDRIPLELDPTPVDVRIPTWLFTLGHPGGVSQIFTSQGRWVKKRSNEELTTNLDVFSGNSGSPVFNLLTHKVQGMVMKGEDDLYRDDDGILKEKRYSFESIQSGHRGEICQAIASIYPDILGHLPT